MEQFYEYSIIKEHYGDQRAKRSGLLYMNHIDEAMKILDSIHADEETKRAYCLHPIFQSDDGLAENINMIRNFDPYIVALVMEYRKTAMGYLSKRQISSIDEIQLSPLLQVNMMVYADKVQNKKDFDLYHKDIHPRSKELEVYFDNWLKKLKQVILCA